MRSRNIVDLLFIIYKYKKKVHHFFPVQNNLCKWAYLKGKVDAERFEMHERGNPMDYTPGLLFQTHWLLPTHILLGINFETAKEKLSLHTMRNSLIVWDHPSSAYG